MNDMGKHEEGPDLLAGEEGATAVEYGLMVALIAVAIIGAVTAVGDSLVAIFETIELHTALNN